MSQVKLFWKLPPGYIVTAEEYYVVKENAIRFVLIVVNLRGEKLIRV
jgi:hypothetical protein